MLLVVLVLFSSAACAYSERKTGGAGRVKVTAAGRVVGVGESDDRAKIDAVRQKNRQVRGDKDDDDDDKDDAGVKGEKDDYTGDDDFDGRTRKQPWERRFRRKRHKKSPGAA